MERLLYEVKKVIVGQDHLLERLVVALLARGHVLVEGVPGLAKTLAIKTLAGAIGGDYKRIQFTPDLVPADLVGTRMYNQKKTAEFNDLAQGPSSRACCSRTRSTARQRVQGALLEVMQERQVTIGRDSFRPDVPEPFLVLATQNPIETEGTYALPEAQVDRFMLKIAGRLSRRRPRSSSIVERMTGAMPTVQQVLTTDQLIGLQKQADAVYVDPALFEYAVRLATATRMPKAFGLPDVERYITYGASPRASINLILTARASPGSRCRFYRRRRTCSAMAIWYVMLHRPRAPR